MRGTLSLIAAAHAAVALAAFIAVRAVTSTLFAMRRQGGGVIALAEGVADAARWPLVAAWLAVCVSVLALLLARRNAPQERALRSATLVAVAIGAGIAAVFVFREIVTLISAGIVPPGRPVSVIIAGLTSASWITALCAVAAITAAVMTRGRRAAMSVVVLAVLVSLGVSATMIVTVRDLSGIYEEMSIGNSARFRARFVSRSTPESPRSSNVGR